MNIGEMRYKIIVQQKVSTRDVYGAVSSSYEDLYNLKASVKYNGGSKGVDNSEIFNSKAVTFETYYRNITEDMQIVFAGKKYSINSIIPIEFRFKLQLNCELIND
jgi:head-tail adaptor